MSEAKTILTSEEADALRSAVESIIANGLECFASKNSTTVTAEYSGIANTEFISAKPPSPYISPHTPE